MKKYTIFLIIFLAVSIIINIYLVLRRSDISDILNARLISCWEDPHRQNKYLCVVLTKDNKELEFEFALGDKFKIFQQNTPSGRPAYPPVIT